MAPTSNKTSPSPLSGTTPSKLVRGLSNTPHDKLAPLVLSALKECEGAQGEWHDVTPEMVEVKDCSGHGGCKTFKVPT